MGSDLERTFELEELDEAFWNKVVFVEVWGSSGMGGPGCIWMVTEDKKIYCIGFDGFPYEGKLEKFHPFFQKERCDSADGRFYRYVAEQNGWKWSQKGKALVREDLFDAFEKVWTAAYDYDFGEIHYVFGAQVMGIVLGAEGEMERWDYVVSARRDAEKMEFYQKLKEEHKRKKLTEEYLVWKPLYDNNMADNLKRGYYCLLLKEYEGRIFGVRLTIAYQWEEYAPMSRKWDAPIQEYILFEKGYEDIRGALEYGNPEKKNRTSVSWFYHHFADTLNDYEINDKGDFVRAFSSLEEAKQYALEVADCRHQINKENIITDIHDRKIRRLVYKNKMKEYDGVIQFGEKYREILEIISKYEFPDEYSGGGPYIYAELEEKMGLNEEMIREMMQFIPTSALLPRCQRKAKALREELKQKQGL